MIFVLEKMTQRAAHPEETIKVLTENMEILLERFPDVIAKFLKDDKFCFNHGTIRVPKSVFDGTETRPIGMVFIHGDNSGDLQWKASEDEVKKFWKEHPKLKNRLDPETNKEEHVVAVSRFVGIEDVVDSNGKSIVANLNASKKCPVDVFKCEALKTNVHWKWHNYLSSKFQFGNAMYLFSVAFFFVFATYYGQITCQNKAWNVADLTGDTEEWNLTIARVSLCLSFCFLVIAIICSPTPHSW